LCFFNCLTVFDITRKRVSLERANFGHLSEPLTVSFQLIKLRSHN